MGVKKPKLNQNTKGISITLPEELIEKLNLFVSTRKGMNVSRTVKHILEAFFSSGQKDTFLPELEEDDLLVSIESYAEMMEISRNTITTRANKGEIALVDLYGNNYVKINKNNIKNIFGQLIEMKKQMAVMREIVYKKIDQNDEFDKAIQKLEKELQYLKKEKT